MNQLPIQSTMNPSDEPFYNEPIYYELNRFIMNQFTKMNQTSQYYMLAR